MIKVKDIINNGYFTVYAKWNQLNAHYYRWL